MLSAKALFLSLFRDAELGTFQSKKTWGSIRGRIPVKCRHNVNNKKNPDFSGRLCVIVG
jgi:hypothetical protein